MKNCTAGIVGCQYQTICGCNYQGYCNYQVPLESPTYTYNTTDYQEVVELLKEIKTLIEAGIRNKGA